MVAINEKSEVCLLKRQILNSGWAQQCKMKEKGKKNKKKNEMNS